MAALAIKRYSAFLLPLQLFSFIQYVYIDLYPCINVVVLCMHISTRDTLPGHELVSSYVIMCELS
jgi:hypothetical protein